MLSAIAAACALLVACGGDDDTPAPVSVNGQFLDGADGKGLDIVSGNVAKDKVVLGINRKKLNGAMIARLQDSSTLNITISVKVEDTMVPVIGVSLNRQVDNMAVGSIE